MCSTSASSTWARGKTSESGIFFENLVRNYQTECTENNMEPVFCSMFRCRVVLGIWVGIGSRYGARGAASILKTNTKIFSLKLRVRCRPNLLRSMRSIRPNRRKLISRHENSALMLTCALMYSSSPIKVRMVSGPLSDTSLNHPQSHRFQYP